MECLIEIVDRPDHRVIRLAGRLTEAQVPELRHACADKTRSIQLHLGELVSVDAPGLEALNLLRCAGTELVEVPTYIQLKLDFIAAKTTARRR